MATRGTSSEEGAVSFVIYKQFGLSPGKEIPTVDGGTVIKG